MPSPIGTQSRTRIIIVGAGFAGLARGFSLRDPAWLLWCVAHVYFLIGFRSRFSVALN
jgi:NADH dehydrogenase